MPDERLTYCRICAAACGVVVTVDGDRVVGVRGDPDHPASRGYTCPKGRALAAFHHAPERLDRPRLEGREVSWDAALDDLAVRLRQVRADHGANGVGFYLATGLAFDSAGQIAAMTWFGAQGSRQLYTAVTVDNAPVLVAAELVAGHPMLNPVWDPDQPGLLLIIGSNPMVSHGYGTAMADPIGHLRRFRASGGRVWVVDPRRTETAANADRHLAVRPGGDTAVLAWLCREVLAEGADGTEVAERCDPADVERLRSALDRFTLEQAVRATELDDGSLVDLLADVRAHAGRVAVMCGTGLTMGRDGILGEWLRWVLLILAGSLDRKGGMRFNRGAIQRLRRQRPAGTSERPGPPTRPELRTVIGQYPCVAMVDEIEAGNLRALVIGGGNPLAAFPDPRRTRAALASLDVLAVVDVADSALTGLATHVLPATGQLERADVTSAEGVAMRSGVQYTPAIVAAAEARKPVWWIFGQLGRRTGHDVLGGADPDRLTDEDYLSGVLSRSSLEAADVFAAGPRGIDVPPEYGWVAGAILPDGRWRVAPPELVARLDGHRVEHQHDGMVLVNRRDVRRINSVDYAGARVGRDDDPIVRLHPDDAAARSIEAGDVVRIATDDGAIEAAVHVDPGVRPRTVSVNHGRDTACVSELTSATGGVDPLTGMPLASNLPVRRALSSSPPR